MAGSAAGAGAEGSATGSCFGASGKSDFLTEASGDIDRPRALPIMPCALEVYSPA